MIEFQVRRVLADADLDTPAGRDLALEEARKLISVVPERTATRDALVREAADRLDVPTDYVLAPAAAPAQGPAPIVTSSGDVLRAERELLTLCLSSGELGRQYLARPDDEHFSLDLNRRAREHLMQHFEDPLVGLPEDDPALAALVSDIAVAAQERPPTHERVLRMSILELERRRIEREIRRASQEGEHARKSQLAAAEQNVKHELGTLMGQTA